MSLSLFFCAAGPSMEAAAAAATVAYIKLVALLGLLPKSGHDNLVFSIDACLNHLAADFSLSEYTTPCASQSDESVASLQRRLKYQKTLMRKATASYEEELPSKVWVRLANIWHVRAAFSKPTIPVRTLAEFIKQFPCSWSSIPQSDISAATITRSRDAFCELIKRFNVEAIAKAVSELPRSGEENLLDPVFIPHIHDEVNLRAKNMAQLPAEFAPDNSRLNRARTSKVQNQVVHVVAGGQSHECLAELAALHRKDGATLALSMCNTLEELLEAFKLGLSRKSCPDSKLRVLHLICGDGVGTNENSVKRLWGKMKNRPTIEYSVLVWRCSSHQSNLCVYIAVCGDTGQQANNHPTTTACVRWFKYLLADYNEEFALSLRQWVFNDLPVRQTAGGFYVRS